MTSMCQPTTTRLECSACGAAADAACSCGAEYLPASMRAAKAIEVSPEKSDRAIADETGIGHATVSRARKKATVSGETVIKRVGKDGKVRKLPAVRAAPDSRAAFLSHADQAIRLATYSGPTPASEDIIVAATKAAAAWSALVIHLREKPATLSLAEIESVEALLGDLELGSDDINDAVIEPIRELDRR